MNADERNLLAELNAAIDDDGGPSTDSIEAGPMTAATWGCCPAPRRPWRAADPRGRVPRARGPRRGRTAGPSAGARFQVLVSDDGDTRIELR